ncbi:M23 family metallopeptidase [Steroidobacter cummioxidans]|uniref:M23 family metallopeptidase n=1 Tax=Steroidobacter cummioxidans TaxID=1803913 RepID=UPI0023AFFDBC|nr:M23 family metallopeptidase [Steroidobacter cummioxidans]
MHGRLWLRICSLVASGCLLSACWGGDDEKSYDCSVFPPAQSSAYILPWHVGQTYVARPHAAREASPTRYAIDVPMPIGTHILASRAGVVIGVIENYVDGDNTLGHENWVFVRHEDNTVGAYAHLTNMGAMVEEGESVAQGALIGLSGHTGNSTQPHLHFDVRPACPGGQPCASLPSDTVPLNFRNAQPSRGDLSCGLRAGVSYTALAE